MGPGGGGVESWGRALCGWESSFGSGERVVEAVYVGR